jgi:hypothetical protein
MAWARCGACEGASVTWRLGSLQLSNARASMRLVPWRPLPLPMLASEHHPAAADPPAACKTFPRRIAFCHCPASAAQRQKLRGDRASHPRLHYPGECDPQPMCTSFVAQQWHKHRQFVASRQHSVNNPRGTSAAFRHNRCEAHAAAERSNAGRCARAASSPTSKDAEPSGRHLINLGQHGSSLGILARYLAK